MSECFTADVNQIQDNFISIALYLKEKCYLDSENTKREVLLKGDKTKLNEFETVLLDATTTKKNENQ